MTFNEVLSQTVAMLHQHGRVSYRALKRQFAIDNDYLADLTDAICFDHPQVRDEEGIVNLTADTRFPRISLDTHLRKYKELADRSSSV